MELSIIWQFVRSIELPLPPQPHESNSLLMPLHKHALLKINDGQQEQSEKLPLVENRFNSRQGNADRENVRFKIDQNLQPAGKKRWIHPKFMAVCIVYCILYIALHLMAIIKIKWVYLLIARCAQRRTYVLVYMSIADFMIFIKLNWNKRHWVGARKSIYCPIKKKRMDRSALENSTALQMLYTDTRARSVNAANTHEHKALLLFFILFYWIVK